MTKVYIVYAVWQIDSKGRVGEGSEPEIDSVWSTDDLAVKRRAELTVNPEVVAGWVLPAEVDPVT